MPTKFHSSILQRGPRAIFHEWDLGEVQYYLIIGYLGTGWAGFQVWFTFEKSPVNMEKSPVRPRRDLLTWALQWNENIDTGQGALLKLLYDMDAGVCVCVCVCVCVYVYAFVCVWCECC